MIPNYARIKVRRHVTTVMSVYPAINLCPVREIIRSRASARPVRLADDAPQACAARPIYRLPNTARPVFTPCLARPVIHFPRLVQPVGRGPAHENPCFFVQGHPVVDTGTRVPILFFCFFLENHPFDSPANSQKVFTLIDLLDKPWSQVPSLLPPGRVQHCHCSSIFIERGDNNLAIF